MWELWWWKVCDSCPQLALIIICYVLLCICILGLMLLLWMAHVCLGPAMRMGHFYV